MTGANKLMMAGGGSGVDWIFTNASYVGEKVVDNTISFDKRADNGSMIIVKDQIFRSLTMASGVISSSSLDAGSYDPSVSGYGTLWAGGVKNDGTKIYGITYLAPNWVLREWNLNSGWPNNPFSSAPSFVASKDPGIAAFYKFKISPTGKYFYLLDNVNQIHRLNLTTPWQISNSTVDETNLFADMFDVYDFQFSSSGNQVAVTGKLTSGTTTSEYYLWVFELDTPFNVSAASTTLSQSYTLIGGSDLGFGETFMIDDAAENLYITSGLYVKQFALS